MLRQYEATHSSQPSKAGFFIALNKSNWHKTSSHSRGYGWSWQKLRIAILKRDNGLCMCDQCEGGKKRLLPAHEVHHVIPKCNGGTDEIDNLISINRECHKRITAADQGRAIKPKVTIGLDGFPKA